ncbi:hypothetical protein OE88DRAFT_1369332 [Heliocybe sulcata]|uniref:Ubiquitin-like protease family profile domain-containing protein n=1 Tax=Heliocybe sulcata TaxID=5364 RepID=A0A5C3N4X5_9AGAM|nr:hypothetical protein OE88DRAFT_1369332 [Heliocybe sulcata]
MMSDNASGMSSTTQREENAVEEQLFDYQGSHSGSELVDARPESPATVNGTEATGNGAAVPIYAREDEAPSLRSSSLTPVASDVEMEESLKDQGHAGQGSLPVDAGDAPRKSGVPPSKFYSSSSKKGKRKSDPVPFPMDIDHPPGEQGNDLASALEGRGSIDDGRPSTYIFTLDSLNTGHKQVINVLARYLHMEAKDKKDLEETSPAIGLQAHVPLQPNYCDCGLYLLHFAKTFMKDPDRAARLIRSKKKGTDLERRTDWEAKDIGDFRDELSARIHSLSDEWKKERAAKEEERKKLAAEDSAQANTAANDSDDDIIVEDVRPAKPRTPRGVKRKDRGEDTPAERLR